MQSSLPARRRPSVKRIALVSAIAWAFLLVATIAAAEDTSEDELRRWVPGLAFSFDMLRQKGRGEIATSNVLGPPLTDGGCLVTQNVVNPNPPPLFILVTSRNGTLCSNSQTLVAPSSQGGDTDVVPLVNAALELATPSLLDSFLYPRLFAHADVALAFGFERTLSGERKPDDFIIDPLPPSRQERSEGEIGGQGSRAIVQRREIMAGGGAGIAFTTSIFDRKIRIKPSAEYLYQEVDLIASVRRAVALADPARTLNDFRLIDLHTSSKEALHGIGGGLELELDAGQMGPIMVSVFILGRAYHFTGNLNHTLRQTNEFGESATWRFELDPWAYRAGVGARFKFLPE
jgi:hypothetical protein